MTERKRKNPFDVLGGIIAIACVALGLYLLATHGTLMANKHLIVAGGGIILFGLWAILK